MGTNFKLFFSFDYLGGGQPWASGAVTQLLRDYGADPAHYKHNNRPLVSTFEGRDNINDWDGIRAAVPGGIFFVPDWTSLGPSGFASHLNTVDGAFSWNMWPDGPKDVTADPDQEWKSAIGNKAYMMGVSPWFFTKLPGYNKAWVWRGDDMWHQRWQQVYQIRPDFVQIVTWNDYGESHYIGPIWNDGIPNGPNTNAHPYVDNMPHDAWRDLLPYYIAQYKNGGTPPAVTTEKVHYWYRLTPAAAGSSDGVTGNHCRSPINIYGYQQCYDPNTIVQDKIFFTALLRSPADVTVQIGDNTPVSFRANSAGANHFSQPFNGQTGPVKVQIVRDGVVVVSGTGTAIQASPANGITNYNAWVGGASA